MKEFERHNRAREIRALPFSFDRVAVIREISNLVGDRGASEGDHEM